MEGHHALPVPYIFHACQGGRTPLFAAVSRQLLHGHPTSGGCRYPTRACTWIRPAMNPLGIVAEADAPLTGSRNGAGVPPLWGRKAVLTGIAASMGILFANAARPSVATAATGDTAGTPTYTQSWAPSTSYALGQQVISPDNDVVSANIAHNSSADFVTDVQKWTRSVTYTPRVLAQVVEQTAVEVFRVQPVTAGNEPFAVQTNSFPNVGAGGGTFNHGTWMGWNPGRHSTGAVTPGKAGMMMGFEDNYFDYQGSHKYGPEWYVEYWSPDGTSQQMLRPFYCRVEGSDTNTASNCIITHDIGSDGLGTFQVYSQGMGVRNPLLIVQANGISLGAAVTVAGSVTASTFVGGGLGASANKDVSFRAGLPTGQVLFYNSTASFINLQISESGAITLRDGMTFNMFGATGAKFGGSATQKFGFWGAAPVVRPTGTPAESTDLASVLALANSLRTSLLKAGLVG
jgi:hypothetical protein